MCIICIDLEKNKLTPWEAARNRKEMLSEFDEEHLKVLDEKITEATHQYLNNLNKNENND
jgi:hypothetical protein|tara:strand:- start:160 stop:339 length:180 start_codon:yes stop_codon:yes gene_type:complete